MNPAAPNQHEPTAPNGVPAYQPHLAPEHSGYAPHAAQDAPSTAYPYDPQAPLMHYQPAPQPQAPQQTYGVPQTMPAKPTVAPPSNPNSTQNTLQIAEIRDGIVIMSNGSFRSVVMAKSINFDLMSPQEQEAVEYSYQGFLNSLYFPVQIFIRSQRVDLQPYIAKLLRKRTTSLC